MQIFNIKSWLGLQKFVSSPTNEVDRDKRFVRWQQHCLAKLYYLLDSVIVEHLCVASKLGCANWDGMSAIEIHFQLAYIHIFAIKWPYFVLSFSLPHIYVNNLCWKYALVANSSSLAEIFTEPSLFSKLDCSCLLDEQTLCLIPHIEHFLFHCICLDLLLWLVIW